MTIYVIGALILAALQYRMDTHKPRRERIARTVWIGLIWPVAMCCALWDAFEPVDYDE